MTVPYLPRLDLLLLGADEFGSALDVAMEFDQISETVERTTPDDHVRFAPKQRRRTKLAELPQLLCEHPPHLLHISGDANDAGELVFAGETVDPRQLATTILHAVSGLRCVVLNVCNGEQLAACLSEHVDVVISMRGVVEDNAARVFALSLIHI